MSRGRIAARPEPWLVPGVHSAQLLHSGAESVVYRARRAPADSVVVVKVLRAAGPQGRRDEIELWRMHSSIRGVHSLLDDGVTEKGNRSYAVMEDCPEGDYEWISVQRGPLPVEEVRAVGTAIADALAGVHARGLLHHAVEPANILKARFGPALIDFGSALPQDAPFAPVYHSRESVRFAPPEELAGGAPSPASDVYRLAATLWTLLAGRAPFEDAPGEPESAAAYRARVLGGAVPFLPREDVPEWFAAALGAGLAPDPALRVPTAEEFGRLLREEAAPVLPAGGTGPHAAVGAAEAGAFGAGAAGAVAAFAAAGTGAPEAGHARAEEGEEGPDTAAEVALDPAEATAVLNPGTEPPAADAPAFGAEPAPGGRAADAARAAEDDDRSAAGATSAVDPVGLVGEPAETAAPSALPGPPLPPPPGAKADSAPDAPAADLPPLPPMPTAPYSVPTPAHGLGTPAHGSGTPAHGGMAAGSGAPTPGHHTPPRGAPAPGLPPLAPEAAPPAAPWPHAGAPEQPPAPPAAEPTGPGRPVHAGPEAAPPAAGEDFGADAVPPPPYGMAAAVHEPFTGPGTDVSPVQGFSEDPAKRELQARALERRRQAESLHQARMTSSQTNRNRPLKTKRRPALYALAAVACVVVVTAVGLGAASLLSNDSPLPPQAGEASPVEDGESIAEDAAGSADSAEESNAPTPSASAPDIAPTGVALRDGNITVALSWEQGSGEEAVHYVVGGPTGGEESTMASVPAGENRVEITGLNPDVEYCFRVVAVQSTEVSAASERVCTERTNDE
ncbi:protein kinase domain-containing protein [Streptomonospora nanhaiensis]|uniref:protein kinase domain-containing protein n=1 Tax=Streptomonospora nanhaiensis TaxID=1323731 RepID=UPI001C390E72|nr:protein kinase [Streptomonospora nanhaiensis]MBV2365743.1 fibronectin type III domain-containing protein [Streptomonospora nanhaiensis]